MITFDRDLGSISSDDPRFTGALDRRIALMRVMVLAMSAPTAADTLRALRIAFPDSSLDERVRAATGARH
jgi:hypothetical protein